MVRAKVRLPAGTDGAYYFYVITDSYHQPGQLGASPASTANYELFSGDNANALYTYAATAYEAERIDNNVARGTLNVTYREPDLQIDSIVLSNTTPSSGQPLTVTWTVTNRGTRDARSNFWSDGIYLSRDASLA